jgi:hypothetical protein
LGVAGVCAQGFLERATLVHGGGGNHAAIIGDSFHARKFSRSQFHDETSTGTDRPVH